MDIDKILRKLKRRGFTLTSSRGSLYKLYPPPDMKDKPFYSLHIGSDRAIHPLRRWCKKEYGLDLFNLD